MDHGVCQNGLQLSNLARASNPKHVIQFLLCRVIICQLRQKEEGIHSFKPALLGSHSEMHVGLMTQAKEALTRLEVPVG
jgi:hypothetical protein